MFFQNYLSQSRNNYKNQILVIHFKSLRCNILNDVSSVPNPSAPIFTLIYTPKNCLSISNYKINLMCCLVVYMLSFN